MSTIEDKILDGPRVHYCEADDDDIRSENEDSKSSVSGETTTNHASSLFIRPDEETERLERLESVRWQGASTNTGPKGVIEDYKRQIQSNQHQRGSAETDNLEAEFLELLHDDTILNEYIEKRIAESVRLNQPIFGRVYRLQEGSQLLDAIDKENPHVLVIVHIFTRFTKSCTRLNECLDQLASEMKHIKFVTLDAGVTQLSDNFKANGVPALLAYRNKDLVKSLVQLGEFLDKDFEVAQVKDLLIENGLSG